MAKYETLLDWAGDQHEAFLLAHEHGLEVEVREVNGPAGGAPVIIFRSDKLTNMTMFLLKYSNHDLETFKLAVEDIWRMD